MKRLSYLVSVSIVVSIFFTGCSTGGSDIDKSTVESTVPVKPTESTESIESIPIEIIALDENEIKDVLNEFPNFKASENIYIGIPKKTLVYDYIFTTTPEAEVDMKLYETAFQQMFAYLFPGHDLDEEYLIYRGGSSDIEYDNEGNLIQDYNKVRDWYDKIMSGEEGGVIFIYDETWYMDMTEWKSPVCLVLSNPIGYGYAIMNKGKTVELTNAKVYDVDINSERYVVLDSYDPVDWLECVGTYSPESTESFQLLDKEIPINEAVAFFENYINNLPYPKESNVDTCVVEVDVLKVNENTYGYNFWTTKKYEGICFDHMRSGTQHSDFSEYVATGGYAFMLESDDIDVLYGYYQVQGMESVTPYTEIVSFESAAKAVSEHMTKSVEFDVERVELVYTQKPKKTALGYIDTENYSCEVTPAWKFTLYNANDEMAYVCYIDARNGSFRFYKTPNGVRRLQ